MTPLTELKQKAIKLGLLPEDVRQFGHLGKKATWEAAIANHQQSVISNQSSVASDGQVVKTPIETAKPIQTEEVEQVATVEPDPIAWIDGEPVYPSSADPVEPSKEDNEDIGDGEEGEEGEEINDDDDEEFADATFQQRPGMFPYGQTLYPVCPWCEGKGVFAALVWFPDLDCEGYETTACSHCGGSGQLPPDPTEDDDEEDDDEEDDDSCDLDSPNFRKLDNYWRNRSITTINISALPPKLPDSTEDNPPSLRDELLQKMATYVGEVIPPQEFEEIQNSPLDEPTAAILLGWLNASERLEAMV